MCILSKIFFDLFDDLFDAFDHIFLYKYILITILPVQISPDVRLAVIRYYLKGYSREEIASRCMTSTGTVTNIVNEWSNNIGSLVVDDLRELALSLKKAQISPVECVSGLRIVKMMQRFGIDEEKFEDFMTKIYNKCQILELGPNQIGDYLYEILNLSNTIFPSQIPNYINTKKRHMENLKEQTKSIEKTISELNYKKVTVEKEIESLLKNRNNSRDAIKWYDDVIKELKNNGIPIDNIEFFIQCLKGIKNEGYEINKVIMKYSQSNYLNESIELKKSTKHQILQDISKLEKYKKSLGEQINRDRLKIYKLQELEGIGFGLKELKTIYNTIIELTKENNRNPREAIEEFFNDLNEYDNFVDLKKKIEDLKQESSSLNIQINTNRLLLASQQHIGNKLQSLLSKGMSEKDIENINSILSLGEFEYYDNYNNKIIVNKQSLIDELVKYRNIKLLIQSLEQKQIHLINSIEEFENQKTTLEFYINYLFVLLSNLKEIRALLNKTSIVLENPKLLLILCYISISKDKDDEKDFKKNSDSPN